MTDRDILRKIAGFHTVMEVCCIWCRKVFDYKDGLGSRGKTSSVCPACRAEGKGVCYE